MGELYVGMDLHSRNTFTGIMTKGSRINSARTKTVFFVNLCVRKKF